MCYDSITTRTVTTQEMNGLKETETTDEIDKDIIMGQTTHVTLTHVALTATEEIIRLLATGEKTGLATCASNGATLLGIAH